MQNNEPRLGIIGSGRLGTALAKQALHAGYTVRIANAHGPDSLQLILKVLLPGATASTIDDAIAQSDIIILAMPMNQYKTLNADLFKNKIVIDAMNYWAPTEGPIAEFNGTVTSSEIVQRYLPDALVVKTLNHVAYNELNEHATEPNHPGSRAIALAGNDAAAKIVVSQVINKFGFDPIDFGDLSEGGQFQPDTRLFNNRLSTLELNQYKQ